MLQPQNFKINNKVFKNQHRVKKVQLWQVLVNEGKNGENKTLSYFCMLKLNPKYNRREKKEYSKQEGKGGKKNRTGYTKARVLRKVLQLFYLS